MFLYTDPERVERDAGIVGRDLPQQVRVDLGVGHVLLEVGAAARDAGRLQLVVHPAQQDGLRRQRQQVLDALLEGTTHVTLVVKN